jgi:threonine/homoserine/homoserine lactone efflux protein
MTDLWLTLIPMAIAMALAPGRIIALILLFHTRRGVLTAVAFVGGMSATMLIEGIALGLIFSITGAAAGEEGGGPPPAVSMLLIVVGILMVVGAAKLFFQEEDEDRPPPKWLDQIESFTPRKAFNLGLGWLLVSPKQWIFTAPVVGAVYAANLSVAGSLISYLLFILIAQALYLLLIIIDVAMPERSAALLDALFTWLRKNARAVLIGVFLTFGLFFFWNGFQGLLG